MTTAQNKGIYEGLLDLTCMVNAWFDSFNLQVYTPNGCNLVTMKVRRNLFHLISEFKGWYWATGHSRISIENMLVGKSWPKELRGLRMVVEASPGNTSLEDILETPMLCMSAY